MDGEHEADQPTVSGNGMILGIQYLSADSLCQVTTELTPLSLCKVGRSRAPATSLVYYFELLWGVTQPKSTNMPKS